MKKPTPEPILDDSKMDKMYRELGGHDTNSQTLTKAEKELLKKIDEELDKLYNQNMNKVGP